MQAARCWVARSAPALSERSRGLSLTLSGEWAGAALAALRRRCCACAQRATTRALAHEGQETGPARQPHCRGAPVLGELSGLRGALRIRAQELCQGRSFSIGRGCWVRVTPARGRSCGTVPRFTLTHCLEAGDAAPAAQCVLFAQGPPFEYACGAMPLACSKALCSSSENTSRHV
jgi:hypothetical protein